MDGDGGFAAGHRFADGEVGDREGWLVVVVGDGDGGAAAADSGIVRVGQGDDKGAVCLVDVVVENGYCDDLIAGVALVPGEGTGSGGVICAGNGRAVSHPVVNRGGIVIVAAYRHCDFGRAVCF